MFEVATSLVLTNNGVKVRMVTGDNPQTAKAKCFMDIQMQKEDEIAGKISVMGTSSLNAKLLLVQALKTCFGG